MNHKKYEQTNWKKLDKNDYFKITYNRKGKFDLYNHGFRHPLLTFRKSDGSDVILRLTFRFNDATPVSEYGWKPNPLIYAQIHYRYCRECEVNDSDAFQKVIDYLRGFI